MESPRRAVGGHEVGLEHETAALTAANPPQLLDDAGEHLGRLLHWLDVDADIATDEAEVDDRGPARHRRWSATPAPAKHRPAVVAHRGGRVRGRARSDRRGRPRGSRGPRTRLLRPAPGSRPRRRGCRGWQRSSPATSRHGWTRAPGGAWPSTTRSGSAARASPARTVSSGSSPRTVPAPTRTASLSARSRWTSARASGPVIHRDVAVGRGGSAVERGRQLQDDVRPTGAPVLEVRGQLPRTASAPDADLDVDAGITQPGDARDRARSGRGPRRRPRPA